MILRAVCRQRRNVSLDLIKQLWDFGGVADTVRRQLRGDDLMRVGIGTVAKLGVRL